ncbi:MAG: DUF1080 domain-containing protein [Cytophagales bacterium]|nr:DUF1080 domain-containing protein [Bernardetiaceae bacterium]MDW8210586.1 DUF1080 domain-containing protein [Cytophagales bacterium]
MKTLTTLFSLIFWTAFGCKAQTVGAWEDLSSLDKWRNFKSQTINQQWQPIKNGFMLRAKGGGDIITKDQYENFELQLEWKISPKGNSGIFFHVVENEKVNYVWESGPEMQILDNEGHPDGKIRTHRAGDNYDLHSCSVETVKPVGKWNKVKIIVNRGKVAYWLNGTKVVEYQLGSPEWEELYRKSKFKDMPYYGKAGKGHIALQDHGDVVWFRNIRIRRL